mmetsp:Transcript_30645/g.98630  ORF Transcript_30645/g.98630 Transcript_30645/m.98630 type:complete len:316 (-) Transcript_30645:26-973(-)
MATAIDFKALLEAEKKKALQQLRKGEENGVEGEADGSRKCTPGIPTPSPTWQELEDLPVSLARREPMELDKFRVGGLASLFYIPNFLTEEEGAAILRRVSMMPESSWANLKRRRLQNHGGTPHPDGMIPSEVPQFIHAVMDALVQAGVFKEEERPNHVLLNEYARGQGIAPHQDGPLYMPLVAILSLDGPALLQFWPSLHATKCGEAVASVLCLSNSLLVFNEEAYESHWHGIVERGADNIEHHTCNLHVLGDDYCVGTAVERGRRISLTVRRVLKIRDGEERILTQEAMEEEKRKERWWLSSRGEEHQIFQPSR